eukprot:12924456-Prorocentrum_lima.AAC.1
MPVLPTNLQNQSSTTKPYKDKAQAKTRPHRQLVGHNMLQMRSTVQHKRQAVPALGLWAFGL